MVTVKDVVSALSQCNDPELGTDIVSIGLIQGINIDNVGNVKVKLTMTSPMCPVTSIIMADAQLRLQAIPGVKNVELDLSWDPLWDPEMMSDEIKYRT
ncbi:MAG: metal-sulfur cluster assembly factor [Candidatus Marsarchaeota archaeon]|nr:metal-sulfur cluster assembly factor [Candidatus Marsarchaeota archaeon]